MRFAYFFCLACATACANATSSPAYEEYRILDGNSSASTGNDNITEVFLDLIIVDSGGTRTIGGAFIHFRVTKGTVDPNPMLTDTNGAATAHWTYDGCMCPGNRVRMTACASNSPTRCDGGRGLIEIGSP